MSNIDLLKILRKPWLEKANQALDTNHFFSGELSYQLEHFYSLLEQAVEAKDPAWFDSILSVWAFSFTQVDLELPNTSLTQFSNHLMIITYTTISENLSPREVIELMDDILPLFAYASQKASQYEVENKLQLATKRLQQVQLNLERLDKSKSDFISVAAHELKTPLTLIQGYAAMLQENMEKQNIKETDQMLLDGIKKGSNRLHLIINDMIDVSLIDNNLLKLNFQPIWLDRIFESLMFELTPNLRERNMKLDVKTFDGNHEMMFGDPERFMQVFRNLLTNAIKYTPDGGRIVVDGRRLPSFVEVTISDTGIGIDPEEQSLIFQNFHKVGNPILHSSGKTKFKGGGPGLGLHIVKGIIEVHGGSIWVDSVGHDEIACPGSTFHVMLPIRKESIDSKMVKLFGTIKSVSVSKSNEQENSA
jgi:signal transduction histidine kinase